LKWRTGGFGLDLHGFAQLLGRERMLRVDADAPIAIDIDMHLRSILEACARREFFEHGVVVIANVGNRVGHRDVQHASRPQ
jgi:hypothetical protein